jgi:uncharacterized membrane protein YhiD involved in acid resistance
MKKLKNQASAGVRRDRGVLTFWLTLLMLVFFVWLITVGFSLAFPGDPALASQPGAQAAVQPNPEEGRQGATSPDEDKPAKEGYGSAETFFSRLFENKDLSSDLTKPGAWRVILTKVPLRLMLAAVLAAMLAYRPQKFLLTMPRNPYIAQTQILLAVVAAALMMIVADNAARAFGIFAAASMVRFRTDIRDPKEVTVLLISLAIGLGTGVGHLALAIIFALFVLALLWVLEYREPAQIFRALELKVKTRNVDQTHERLKGLFLTHQVMAEIQALNKHDKDDPRGRLVYRVRAHMDLDTDKVSEELFSVDRDNVDSVAWQQKKSISYLYR